VRGETLGKIIVVREFGKEASQTRDYCVAKSATPRAARPDPSRDKKRLAQDDKTPK
jgi:hypothetical protein